MARAKSACVSPTKAEFIPVHESSADPPLPFVRMGFMDGSLEDWIGKPDPSIEQRLAALAQCCNGLAWLYQNGLHGHGDLKPANVLLNDLTLTFAPAPGLPRWKAVVADLGWADIWREFEGRDAARRAWRPYLAPERLDGVVEREASDMFGVGVMAAELLGGIHPAGEPTPVGQ